MIIDIHDVELTGKNEEFHYANMKNIISREYWDAVIQCKEKLVKKGEDPRNNRCMRQEVAESWIRSFHLGITPQTSTINSRLEEEKFYKIREENKLLTEGATPLIDNFMELITTSGFTLSLFDKNGTFLEGNPKWLSNTQYGSTIWNEETIGTTAHSLAIYYKKPFQLIGPENYLEIFQNSMCYAAPILDDEGEVLGALAFRQAMAEKPWEQNLPSLTSHSLGWISSLAVAIGNQIKLSKSNDILKKTNEILGVTLEFIDEGIVTVEPDGTIIRTNQEGKRILHLKHEAVERRNISEFLSNWPSLRETLYRCKKVDYVEELIRFEQEEEPWLLSIRPVLKKDSKELSVAILRFSHTEKINALVTSRSGASAKFNFEDIIGQSETMIKTKTLSRRFAGSPENILLMGESGTGKELFAQAIHNKYHSSGPFIAVNCAAMPRNLIESELFGYESGAFTGAERNGRPGKIELANGGTLFLDEIGDMPYELQAVILRVLQDKKVMRLGGKRYQQVNFRLIAATNQNLLELVENKLFREDLFFRLSVLTIEIPPLRERGYDIAILAEYFIKEYARRMGWTIPMMSTATRTKILEYNWPGNVRQLENVIIYAVNLAEEEVIDLEHLPKHIFMKYKHQSNINSASLQENQQEDQLSDFSIKNYEIAGIKNALKRVDNNIILAADLLNISKSTLYRKMKEYDIPY